MQILHNAFQIFLLRQLPFSQFNFPRWQTILGVTLIGGLIGLDPNLRTPSSGLSTMPLWMAVVLGILVSWVAFWVVGAVLKWWMKRSGRWDGLGNMPNLVASSWLISNVLGTGLVALGVPPFITLPLWLYALWVGANALSGAMPRATLGYSLAGVIISMVLAFVAATLVFGVMGILLVSTGVITASS